MTRLRTIAGAGLFAVAAALAIPSMASATTPPEPSTQTPNADARLAVACARLPLVETRVDKAITLLEGDATTRGSIAWLNAQLTKAQSSGRTELATVLQNRIDVRTARLAVLNERENALTDIAAICDAHGFGA